MSRRQHPYDEALEAAACEGFAQGERAERERIRMILESPEAVGREGSAIFLATRTDLPASIAVTTLSFTPRAEAPAFNVRPAKWPAVTLTIVGVIDATS